MHINPKNTGPIRPETTRTSQPTNGSERVPISPTPALPSSADRTDRVEISNAGRALAARNGSVDSASLDPARAAAIRGRILSGAYDTVQVVDAVARRLLDSGDL